MKTLPVVPSGAPVQGGLALQDVAALADEVRALARQRPHLFLQ